MVFAALARPMAHVPVRRPSMTHVMQYTTVMRVLQGVRVATLRTASPSMLAGRHTQHYTYSRRFALAPTTNMVYRMTSNSSASRDL